MKKKQHERYDIPNADILSVNVWAEEFEAHPNACASCGSTIPTGMLVCESCGAPAATCFGSCPSCGSPICVGDKRSR